MRIALIGKKYIVKDKLPKNIIDNYWVVDKTLYNERKLVNIIVNNGKYEIESNEYSKIINIEYLRIKDGEFSVLQAEGNGLYRAVLKENSMYPIMIEDTKEICMLYCLPDVEENFFHFDIIDEQEITIGSSYNSSIIYKDPLILEQHAKIYKFDNKWMIENYDTLHGIFVNDFPVYDNIKNIFNGDIIFIRGLEIIIIGNSLYINNPNNNVKLNDNFFRISKIKNVDIEKIDKGKIDSFRIDVNNSIDYYSRSPRMIAPIKKEVLKIDGPPDQMEQQQKPLVLVLGSSLVMSIVMITSLSSTIQGMVKGTASALETVLGFVTSIAMLSGMILFPILDVKWDKKTKVKYENKRQKRYKQYLKQKRDFINELKNKQRTILFENYISADECAKVIMKKSPRLWERKIEYDDFLTVRMGLGDVDLKVDLSYPQERFLMVEDNLIEMLNEIIENSKTIENAPMLLSLTKNNVSAIVAKEQDFINKYIKNLIIQLVTFHSYEDLKIVFLLDEKNSKEWEYVKMLPHIWDDFKQIRFFADNYEEMNQISAYLMEILNNRLMEQNKQKNYKEFSPYYLIITDNYKKINNLNFITEFLKINNNIGFSLLTITDDMYTVPSNCNTFIDIKNLREGILYQNDNEQIIEKNINIELLNSIFYEKISQKLSNIPIKPKKGEMSLSKNYFFLDMYGVGNIEKLNIYERWRKNDTTLSLKAPIGIDSNGMIVSLDAHEKFHGPHGLIAGSTGSGKSEFIITYILSLAINYHPDDVTFLLIDYKGGGLAGAFQKNNIKLPHLVGTITNIDKHSLKRSLISIQSELRRRQIMFNKARNKTNEGTIDIYKYQKLYHDGIVKEPIPHLFIICDEFAELKQQQLEFMDELVSVSRIGRSLGVHLILATQKPSGVVDDQIRSNSKFAICLKVQDTVDSNDVILRKDAAFLKNPGQFYMKVGHNEYFTLGQSGWAGAPYIPSNRSINKTDTSVEFISNIGFPIKKIDLSKNEEIQSKGEQLTNILEHICDIAKQNNIVTQNLWLDSIPQDIYVQDLKNKYKVKNDSNEIKVLIGEYDDPSNQEQGLVKLDFLNRDNIIIYGNAESGKETLLSTILYGLITSYSTEKVQMYILDFGTEALKIYKNSYHVGDVVLLGQDEKLDTFFDMIQKMIKERKQILSNYNGDYDLYLEKGNVMPIITVLLNNYEVFDENYGQKYDDLFLTLTREGAKCGIVFVVTASTVNAMRYRMKSNFNKKIALLLNDENDYYTIFENVGKKRPNRIFGRGLVLVENEVLEFQTAKICEHIEYNEHIEEIINKSNLNNNLKAISVPTLPDKIEVEDLRPYLKELSKVPIGLIKKNLDVYTYDFIRNFMTVIAAKNMEYSLEFWSYVSELIKYLKNVKILVLDAEEVKKNKEKGYNDFIDFIKEDMEKSDEIHIICVIIGIDKFSSENILNEYEFSDFLTEVKEKGKHSFIIIENPDRLEEHTYDAWYANFIDRNSGIWIGNGADSQTLITSNFSMTSLDNNCGNSFGYVIDEGIATLVKYIGIEEEGDEK